MLMSFVCFASHLWETYHLNILRRRFHSNLFSEGSLLFYHASRAADNLTVSLTDVPALTSAFCDPVASAHVADLVGEEDGRRACSVYPGQTVSLENGWHKSKASELLDASGCLQVVVEVGTKDDSERTACEMQLASFGDVWAWRANDTHVAMLMATDERNLLRLGWHFLSGHSALEDGWTLDRLVSVQVRGKLELLPCSGAARHLSAVARPAVPRMGTRAQSDATIRTHSRESSQDSGVGGGGRYLSHGSGLNSALGEVEVRGSMQSIPASASASGSGSAPSTPATATAPATPTPFGSGIPSPPPPQSAPASDCHPDKPPNVLLVGCSNDVRSVLSRLIDPERYVLVTQTHKEAAAVPWAAESAALVVMSGEKVPTDAVQTIRKVAETGGKVLSIGSDLTEQLLPFLKGMAKTGFSKGNLTYGRWKGVDVVQRMLTGTTRSKRPELPSRTRLSGDDGPEFNLSVLGWSESSKGSSPCLILAKNEVSTFLFSQIQPDARGIWPEVLANLLHTHLDVTCSSTTSKITYVPAYLLGKHELKQSFLASLPDSKELRRPKLVIQFYGREREPPTATASCLPVLTSACPQTFSTLEYFEHLKTSNYGRLVIFADTMTSTMNAFDGMLAYQGMTVIARRQTEGRGRSGNTWISPVGCAMFSTQLSFSLQTPLGQHLPLLQHLVGLAMVQGVRCLPGMQDLPLAIKWPNDVYLGSTKVGGLVVQTTLSGTEAVCNVGCGLNVANELPTKSIRTHLESSGSSVHPPSVEAVVASTFNQLERIVDLVQQGSMLTVKQEYYGLWMHTGAEVTVTDEKRVRHEKVSVLGVDDYGFLEVRSCDTGRIFQVQPDGNSFDLTKGLIAPKLSA